MAACLFYLFRYLMCASRFCSLIEHLCEHRCEPSFFLRLIARSRIHHSIDRDCRNRMGFTKQQHDSVRENRSLDIEHWRSRALGAASALNSCARCDLFVAMLSTSIRIAAGTMIKGSAI